MVCLSDQLLKYSIIRDTIVKNTWTPLEFLGVIYEGSEQF